MTEKNETLTTAADAAAFIERKAEDYAREFGTNDMGSLSFGNEDMRIYHWHLVELADEIRALTAPAQGTQGEPSALPSMPTNVAHVTRRIRRCESDAPAQLVLEHFAMEYARAAVANADQAPSASPVSEPPIYAQAVIENVDAMRVLLQNMLDDDQFDRADNLLTAIAEGIEEAMSDAHGQGEQEGRDSAKASASPAALTDEQIIAIYQDHYTDEPGDAEPTHILPFARALLAASSFTNQGN